MSRASLPYTTLDGPLRLPEPVSWYWRLLAHLSVWLIIGGFLAFPWLTITASASPPGSNGISSAPPIVSTTVLIIIVTSFITAGYGLTPLLVLATPHNRDFHLHSVYLPELSASLLGTLSHILVSALGPSPNLSSLPGVLGCVLGVVASAVYASISLFCSGVIHARLGKADPYGQRVSTGTTPQRASELKVIPNDERNLSYSSSVLPLNPYAASHNHALHHEHSSTSMNSSHLYAQHQAHPSQSRHQHTSSNSSNSYFPPAPFIHPLQHFNWQQAQGQPSPRPIVPSPPPPSHGVADNDYGRNGPVTIIHRPNVGMTTSDMAEDELTRRQMMGLLSRSDTPTQVVRNGSNTYQIDFPGAPRGEAWDSSGTSTPQPSVANTPATYYGSHTWHGNSASGMNSASATWGGSTMGTLPESPPTDKPASIHEVEGVVPTRTSTSSKSVIPKPRTNSITKFGFHEPPPVAAKIVPPVTPKIIIPPSASGFNALGAAVLRGDHEDADPEFRRRREERAREKERARLQRDRRRSSSTADSRSRTPGRSPGDRKPSFQDFRAYARRSRSSSVATPVEGRERDTSLGSLDRL